MKVCSKCGKEKELSEFKFDIRYTQEVTAACKECYKTYARANKASQKWVQKNRDRVKVNQDKYVRNNPDAVKTSKRKWSKANPKKELAKCRKYQADKISATPKWLTAEQLAEMTRFYVDCPEGYEVDHIMPLRGKESCGLHVPWNLQYLTISANRHKSNKIT